MKNPTPRQLALWAASFVTGMQLVILIIIKIFLPESLSLQLIIFLLVSLYLIAFFTVAYVLRRYIYRKIKVIYKTIFRLKRPQNELSMSLDLNNHIIDAVEQEVIEWAKYNSQELEALKTMEDYRRKFLGNVSHELKTPIFNIQGYLYTLLDGGMDDPKIRDKYLKRAINNIERLNAIVQDLMAISQMESGNLQLEFQKFDIYKLANDIFEDLEFKAEERDIQLSFKDGINRSFMVYADRDQIYQVLTNLVSNSIKYGKEGGNTKIGFYDMDNLVLVEISDDGIGISEEHLPHLFERFYRVDKSRSRVAGGTGLGLSIVKHIIQSHKQTINVRSREGIGSTFGFTLEKVDV